jgi:DinB superfamily
MSIRVDDALEVLHATPGTLRSLLSGVSAAWADAAAGDGWSARDVLNHLIFGERTDWVVRARIIATQGEARPFDTFVRDALAGANRDRPIAELVHEFARLRAVNLATLRDEVLRGTPLGATGTHPELGRVTLGELIASWAVHDLEHVGQISAAMAQRYRGEVGPWLEFLAVLER